MRYNILFERYEKTIENAIVAKSPKSKKESLNRIWIKDVPKWFHSSTFKDKDHMTDAIHECDGIVSI